MTTALKSTEIVDAAIALINAAVGDTITFTPAIVQEGDLAFYAENPDGVTLEVPAIFVKPVRVDLNTADGALDTDIDATLVVSQTTLRVVIVAEWEQPDDVEEKRSQYATEVASVFLAPEGLDLDAAIAGYTVIPPSTTTRIELHPPEDEAVNQNQARQLFAVAITVAVRGRASRYAGA